MDSMDFKSLSKKERTELLKIMKSHLKEVDADRLRRAMLSMGWLEGTKELVDPLMQLVADGSPDVALAALEGLSRLRVKESEQPLARHIVNLLKSSEPECEEVRTECIRVLGKVGTGSSVDFMAELVVNPAATDKDAEAAVEALVSLAEGRVKAVYAKLQNLSGKIEGGRVREAIDCAIRELSASDWQKEGYLTIEAEFKPEDE